MSPPLRSIACALLLCLVVPAASAQHATVPVCAPIETDTFYFPAGAFDGASRRGWDETARRLNSEALRAMGEPSLSCGATDQAETYRFLWFRTSRLPVAVRLSRNGSDYSLHAVVLRGGEEYAVARRVTRTLSAREWQRAIAAFDTLGFWDQPTEIPNGEGIDPVTGVGTIRLDSAISLFEGRSSNRYHVIERWDDDGGAHAAGAVFLRLARLPTRPVY
jgi:hypothetical protein